MSIFGRKDTPGAPNTSGATTVPLPTPRPRSRRCPVARRPSALRHRTGHPTHAHLAV